MIRHRHVNMNRPNLFIGPVLAASFRLAPLRAELVRLKIPGIENPSLGKQSLLDIYEKEVRARAEAIRGTAKIGKRPAPISDSHMRRAAAEIEAEAATHTTARRSVSALEKQIAAMPRADGRAECVSPAPSHPIATTRV